MGRADFRVFMAGTMHYGGMNINFATDAGGTDWSLGFREVDGRWKVASITATRIPRAWQIPMGG